MSIKKMITIAVLASMISGTTITQAEGMKRGINVQEGENKEAMVATETGDAMSQSIQNKKDLRHEDQRTETCCEKKDLSEEAAKLENAEAINNLGLCYLEGTGVTKDEEKAVGHFKEAADKKNTKAMCNFRCVLSGRKSSYKG